MARVTIQAILNEHKNGPEHCCHWFDVTGKVAKYHGSGHNCFASILGHYSENKILAEEIWYITPIMCSEQAAAWLLTSLEAWVGHSIRWKIKAYYKGKESKKRFYLSFRIKTKDFPAKKALLCLLSIARYPYEEKELTDKFYNGCKDMGMDEGFAAFQALHQVVHAYNNAHRAYALSPYGYSQGNITLEKFRQNLANKGIQYAQAVFS